MLESIRDAGPFMWLLVALSVVSLTFILDHAWALRRSRVLPAVLTDAISDRAPAGRKNNRYQSDRQSPMLHLRHCRLKPQIFHCPQRRQLMPLQSRFLMRWTIMIASKNPPPHNRPKHSVMVLRSVT